MKKIKVKFIGFWNGFIKEESIFYQILSENYNLEICEDADYIIYSCFDDNILYEPENRAIKIFYSGENETPNFNICDYALAFDHMIFGDRYFRLPVYYLTSFYQNETLLMENKHKNIMDFSSLGKTDFCSFVVSNARGTVERMQMFKELSKYKKVNSGGKYLNNIGYQVESKLEFEKKHKFSICFDNCQYRGYTTEKIVEAFAARTVPIYWGDPEVTKVFNPKAFINVMDYPSIESAIEQIKLIDQDEQLYLSMLKEPALLSKKNTFENTKKELTEWLCGIIDQPIEKARRRGNGFWQTEYYWKLRGYKTAKDKPISTLKNKLRHFF